MPRIIDVVGEMDEKYQSVFFNALAENKHQGRAVLKATLDLMKALHPQEYQQLYEKFNPGNK